MQTKWMSNVNMQITRESRKSMYRFLYRSFAAPIHAKYVTIFTWCVHTYINIVQTNVEEQICVYHLVGWNSSHCFAIQNLKSEMWLASERQAILKYECVCVRARTFGGKRTQFVDVVFFSFTSNSIDMFVYTNLLAESCRMETERTRMWMRKG